MNQESFRKHLNSGRTIATKAIAKNKRPTSAREPTKVIRQTETRNGSQPKRYDRGLEISRDRHHRNFQKKKNECTPATHKANIPQQRVCAATLSLLRCDTTARHKTSTEDESLMGIHSLLVGHASIFALYVNGTFSKIQYSAHNRSRIHRVFGFVQDLHPVRKGKKECHERID